MLGEVVVTGEGGHPAGVVPRVDRPGPGDEEAPVLLVRVVARAVAQVDASPQDVQRLWGTFNCFVIML